MATARFDNPWHELKVQLIPFGSRGVRSYGERIAHHRSPLTRKLWQRRKGSAQVPSTARDASEAPTEKGRERKVLIVTLCLFALLAFTILLPFAPWFVLALWTAAIARPLVDRLTRAIRGRRSAAALVIVGLLVAVGVPLAIGMFTLGADAVRLVRRTVASESGRAALVQLVSPHDDPPPLLPVQPQSSPWSVETLLSLAKEYGVEAWGAATMLAGAVGAMFLGLFVYLVATYGAMVEGRAAYQWFESQVPVAPEKLRRIRDAFVETGYGLLSSVVLTGLVQAVVATIVYAVLGVPRALILGFATFIASMIPSVGSALVWLPIALGLLFADHPTRAAVLVALGFGVISTSDNVLRPLLARWGSLKLHPFLVLFSMLGGVMMLGGWGLILGPLVLRLGLEVLSLVRESSSADATVLAAQEAALAAREAALAAREAAGESDAAGLRPAHNASR